jgi:hypothetical protein
MFPTVTLAIARFTFTEQSLCITVLYLPVNPFIILRS